MADYTFTPPPPTTVPTTDKRLFPVRRVLLIGKNYADHVREMGDDPKSTPPVFFTKPADGVICPTTKRPEVDYPPATENLHYEGEIVLALCAGGQNVPVDDAMALVFGMAAGCDLTRRDIQAAAREKGGPWDMAKGFDQSAVVGPITPGATITDDTTVTLSLNAEQRQHGPASDMIWSPAEIISKLSDLIALAPGDLIFTGTPEGVGPIARGDECTVEVAGAAPLRFKMV